MSNMDASFHHASNGNFVGNCSYPLIILLVQLSQSLVENSGSPAKAFHQGIKFGPISKLECPSRLTEFIPQCPQYSFAIFMCLTALMRY